jgi:prepilin-type N-terminal cleavage/methylation domain-containing protein
MLAQRKRSQGFSLMELMIVVVITGVLAAIAIPTFTSYVQKSRTAEATQVLGVIKLRQEAYRAEFGGYLGGSPQNTCTDAGDMDFLKAENFVPGYWSVMKNGVQKVVPQQSCLAMLGAKPDGPVRFGYAFIQGPPTVPGNVAVALGLQPADYDTYFVAHAGSDLDGDGLPVLFEVSSFTRGVFVMDKNGNALPAGWE